MGSVTQESKWKRACSIFVTKKKKEKKMRKKGRRISKTTTWQENETRETSRVFPFCEVIPLLLSIAGCKVEDKDEEEYDDDYASW